MIVGQNQPKELHPGTFHRWFSRFFLTMYAREQKRSPGKPDEYYRDAAAFQAALVLDAPVVTGAVLVGRAFSNQGSISIFGLTQQQTMLLLFVIAIALLAGVRSAVRNIIRHGAYASENARLHDSPRDRIIAQITFWGVFTAALGIPAIAILIHDSTR
jgi:hypothetical protein